MLKRRIEIGFLIFFCFFVFFSSAFYFRNRIAKKYEQAIMLIESDNYDSYNEAKNILESIGDYKDSYKYINEIDMCISTYESAKKLIEEEDYDSAIKRLELISDFHDSNDILIDAKYKYAELLFEEEKYDMSYKYYEELGDYLDSADKAKTALVKSLNEKKQQLYEKARQYMEYGDYLSAKSVFETILDYKDENDPKVNISTLIDECEMKIDQQKKYDEADKYYKEGSYVEACILFSCLDNYKDSDVRVKECKKKFITENLSTTISAGLHYSVVLKSNGEIYCTNANYTKIKNWKDIISIAGFGTMIVGLEEGGNVKVEGRQDMYDIEGKDVKSANVKDWEDIIQISAGQQHIVGLKKSGHVLVAGLDIPGKREIEEWEDIIFVDTSWVNTVGLNLNGGVEFEGKISENELNKIKSWTGVKAVATGGGAAGYPGQGHVVGLLEDGTVVAAGDNEYGQCDVDDWTDIIAISAGDWHTVGLKSNGDVVSTRPFDQKEISTISACDVDDWEDIVAISAGCGITLGLQRDGKLRSTGYTKEGQRPMDNEWNNIKVYNEWDSMIARKVNSQKQ